MISEGSNSGVYSESLGGSPSTPTIVMLHGWGQSLIALRPLGELLSCHARVILIDLPGFGNSKPPFSATNKGTGWGTDDYATAVKEFLDSQHIERFILVGHSLGGRISVRLAHRFPEAVQGLVLIASAGIPRERSFRDKTRQRYFRAIRDIAKFVDRITGRDTLFAKFSSRFGSRDYKSSGELRKTFVKVVNEDLSPLAQTISCPTLLLWGEKDTETPVDVARKYNRLIRDSKLYILPNKGHEPFQDVGSHLLTVYIERFFGWNRESATKEAV